MSTWSIAGKGAFASLGLSNLRRTLVDQAPDTCLFIAPQTLFDSDPLFAYGETVTIQKDGVNWFLGRVNSVPVQGTIQTESIQYELVGPWWWLTKMVYQQDWKLWDEAEAKLKLKKKSRVILGQKADGTRIANGAQIREVLEYAIARGAPLLIGTIDPTVQTPWSEELDLTCADVITRLLQFSPECVCFFDYSTASPTFHCRKRSNMTAVSVPAVGRPTTTVALTPRYDLRVLGVTINYEQEHEVDAATYESILQDTAGETTDLSALVTTIELAGSRTSYLTQKIATEDFPSPYTNEAWWKTQLPWLADAKISGLSIANGSRDLRGYEEDMPRIMLEGPLPWWMDYDEIGGDGLYARDDVVRAEASYYERSDDGAQHYRENVKLTKPVIATDAESKIYKKLGSFEPGEPVPSGLAAALLASFSELQYDGQIVLDQEECASGLAPGTVLNLTGGRAEWAAMRAVVQQVTEDVTLGRTTVTVGPARHLGPADLVTLLRALRSRKVSTGWAMRKTGDSASNGSTVKLGGKDARRDASSGAGTTKNMTLAKKTGENTQKITLDPAEISKTDAGVEIKPRQVYIYDDASGAWKTREVMCSEAFSPSCGETITVVTAVQYDTVSHQLQVKTRSVRLIPAAAESGWTMVSGGQATVCNECEE